LSILEPLIANDDNVKKGLETEILEILIDFMTFTQEDLQELSINYKQLL
jgi:hypothetical protein